MKFKYKRYSGRRHWLAYITGPVSVVLLRRRFLPIPILVPTFLVHVLLLVEGCAPQCRMARRRPMEYQIRGHIDVAPEFVLVEHPGVCFRLRGDGPWSFAQLVMLRASFPRSQFSRRMRLLAVHCSLSRNNGCSFCGKATVVEPEKSYGNGCCYVRVG